MERPLKTTPDTCKLHGNLLKHFNSFTFSRDGLLTPPHKLNSYETTKINLYQGSPKYGPRATSGPLRPLFWPAELSLKKQTKLGKLQILTPLYSDMHIAKFH